jgi:drug/metabolite transporter (DMT)-like permease
MGVLLGLLTAVSWGSADFLARFGTRKIGTLRTTLYMQLLGFLLLSAALPYLGGWQHLVDGSGWRAWAWGIAAGVLNTFATLTLYRSFEIGKMAVVAPVSAAYPVITVLLSVLAGEHLTPARVLGIVSALAGAILVARAETSSETEVDAASAARHRTGLMWAMVSSGAMGVMFWLLGVRVIPAVGALPAVWLIRAVTVALTLAVILVGRQSASLPSPGSRRFIAGIGVLDTTAYALNNIGMQLEQVSIVSVLASLYGAVTVAYAAVLLRERISRTQWIGIIAIFAGIVLISH